MIDCLLEAFRSLGHEFVQHEAVCSGRALQVVRYGCKLQGQAWPAFTISPRPAEEVNVWWLLAEGIVTLASQTQVILIDVTLYGLAFKGKKNLGCK